MSSDNGKMSVTVNPGPVSASQEGVAVALDRIQEQMEALRQEVAFLSQQNLSMFNATASMIRTAMNGVSEKIIKELKALPLELDVETLSALLAQKMEMPSVEIDLDGLAKDIAGDLAVPAVELDYDALADKIAERVKVPQQELDYDAIAEKMASTMPEVDYRYLASCLAEELNKDALDVDAFASESLEETTEEAVEEVVAAEVVEEEAADEPVAELVEEPAEEPVEEAAEVVEETVEEVTEEVAEEPVEEVAVAAEEIEENEEEVTEEVAEESQNPLQSGRLETDAPVTGKEENTEDDLSVSELTAEEVEEPAENFESINGSLLTAAPGKTIRLKRSFECKLRQSDDELKYYYSEIKNYFLGYKKVKANTSWNGERYNYGRATVARTNIIGKTFCMYLALNPDDYSITKYHQKYVGDTKAYEATPMMIKVKSNMGLRRSLTLIDDVMKEVGAEKTDKKPYDFSDEYSYKTDEEMLAEGQIKVSVTVKKDLTSF